MIKYYLLCLLLCTGVTKATPSNQDGNESQQPILLSQMQHAGGGKMKVMFWDVYYADLYVSNKPFAQDNFPQALTINYLRDIDKDELLDATQDQWQHLNMDKQLRTRWMQELSSIFPSIKKGDSITLIVDSQRQSRFYLSDKQSQYRPIGSVADTEFGRAFLAIWLDEKTSRPKLRRKLIGELQ